MWLQKLFTCCLESTIYIPLLAEKGEEMTDRAYKKALIFLQNEIIKV
jgi:hypothetical protein